MEYPENMPATAVGNVGNYYGGLHIKIEGGEKLWCIENYSGFDWEVCPDNVFESLYKIMDQ